MFQRFGIARCIGNQFLQKIRHPAISVAASSSHRLELFNDTERNTSTQSSRAWLDRQHKDPYVQKAQDMGLPSRGFFKLQEINEVMFYPAISKKDKKKKTTYRRLIQPNMLVLDLGAAPGGWSVYASKQLDHLSGGAIVSVDLLPLNSDVSDTIHNGINGRFEFIQGDFTKKNTRLGIMDAFDRFSNTTDSSVPSKANLIISDMAANFTGDFATDALRTVNLVEQALAFAAGDSCFDSAYSPRDDGGMLMKNGSFLSKFFSCGRENEAELMDAVKRVFRSVHTFKPNASRRESSEMYLLGYNKQ